MAICEGAKGRFRAAFERLPERDRKVAALLYVHDMTLRGTRAAAPPHRTAQKRTS